MVFRPQIGLAQRHRAVKQHHCHRHVPQRGTQLRGEPLGIGVGQPVDDQRGLQPVMAVMIDQPLGQLRGAFLQPETEDRVEVAEQVMLRRGRGQGKPVAFSQRQIGTARRIGPGCDQRRSRQRPDFQRQRAAFRPVRQDARGIGAMAQKDAEMIAQIDGIQHQRQPLQPCRMRGQLPAQHHRAGPHGPPAAQRPRFCLVFRHKPPVLRLASSCRDFRLG